MSYVKLKIFKSEVILTGGDQAFLKKDGVFLGNVFGGSLITKDGKGVLTWEKTKYSTNTDILTAQPGDGYTIFMGLLKDPDHPITINPAEFQLDTFLSKFSSYLVPMMKAAFLRLHPLFKVFYKKSEDIHTFAFFVFKFRYNTKYV